MLSNSDVIARIRECQKVTNDGIQTEINDILAPKTVIVPFNTDTSQIYPTVGDVSGVELVNSVDGDDVVILNTLVENEDGNYLPVGNDFTLSQYYDEETLEENLGYAGLTLESADYPDPRDTSGHTDRTIPRFTKLRCTEERAKYHVSLYAKCGLGNYNGGYQALKLDIKPRHYLNGGTRYWKHGRYASSTTSFDLSGALFNGLGSTHKDTSFVPVSLDCTIDGNTEFGTQLMMPRRVYVTGAYPVSGPGYVSLNYDVSGGSMNELVDQTFEMNAFGSVELTSGEELSATLVCPYNVQVLDGHIALTKTDKRVNHSHDVDLD